MSKANRVVIVLTVLVGLVGGCQLFRVSKETLGDRTTNPSFDNQLGKLAEEIKEDLLAQGREQALAVILTSLSETKTEEELEFIHRVRTKIIEFLKDKSVEVYDLTPWEHLIDDLMGCVLDESSSAYAELNQILDKVDTFLVGTVFPPIAPRAEWSIRFNCLNRETGEVLIVRWLRLKRVP